MRCKGCFFLRRFGRHYCTKFKGKRGQTLTGRDAYTRYCKGSKYKPLIKKKDDDS